MTILLQLVVQGAILAAGIGIVMALRPRGVSARSGIGHAA
jgi:hypothetical protein